MPVSRIQKYSDGRIIIDSAGVIRINFIGGTRIDSVDKIRNDLCLFYDLKDWIRKMLCGLTSEFIERVDVQKEL